MAKEFAQDKIMRRGMVIIGLGLLGFGSVSYHVSSALFQEAIGQSPTSFLPEEWKSTQQKGLATANYLGLVMFAAMPITLVGIPVMIHGLFDKFSVRAALIMGVLLLVGLVVAYQIINPT